MKTTTGNQNQNTNVNPFLKEKAYWHHRLSGEGETGYFPYDYETRAGRQTGTGTVTFTVSENVFSRLMQLRNESDPRLHMVLVAATHLLINQYTGIRDIIVGTTIDRQETQGEYLNTILPLRNQIKDHMTFKQFLLEVRDTVSGAVENQNYPIREFFNQLHLNNNNNEEIPALFEVAILLENLHHREYLGEIEPAVLFSFTRTGKALRLAVEYRASLYKQETMERMVRHFNRLLEIVIFDIDIPLSAIDILSPGEKKEMVMEFNETTTLYPDQKAVHELFSGQAARMPTKAALILDDRETTYHQLNVEANRLAHESRARGVGPGTLAALICQPSPEAVAAILGVLKAGAAYLPIDPGNPRERVRYILADSQPVLILTGKDDAANIPGTYPVILLDNPGIVPRQSANARKANARRAIKINSGLSNPAYLIYTSGTTGNPKGVLVEHGALVNYVRWAACTYIKNEQINFPLYTSLAFDLTMTSLFTPLVTGNTIFIYQGNKESQVEKIFDQDKVEAIKLTPVHLMLMSARKEKAPRLRRLIVGGERLDAKLARNIHDLYKGKIEIYNEYGPTEATVGCMIYRYDPGKDDGHSVPIGVPSANMQIYLLNAHMKHVPVGCSGELYISGRSLARGYLNNPGLTAQRFIPNPYAPGKRMFKTGDRARRLAGGKIEFLGREDHQVKIRGYRVETGEVEYYLTRFEGIRQAHVLARQDEKGYGYLVAYIVFTGQEIAGEDIRHYLSANLPEFMIPSYFVTLSAMPVTVNGKIDLKALPNPGSGAMAGQSHYRPPVSKVEHILANTWQEVMKVDRVGIDDDYFNLGGDSIKAILISSRLRKYNLKLDISDLFQYHTIARLSTRVAALREVAYQGGVQGEVSLTPIQHWFFRQNFKDPHHFNQSVLLYRRQGFKNEIVKTVFHKLADHHDALRMVYKIENRKVKQFNRGLAGPLVDIREYDFVSYQDSNVNQANARRAIKSFDQTFSKVWPPAGPPEATLEEKCNQIQASMDLERGPLLKLGLFKTGKGDYMLVAIHHLVVDTVSLSILFEDFTTLYRQIEKGVTEDNLEIPLKTTSYKEWSEKLYEYAHSEALTDQVKYWSDIEQTRTLPLFERNPGPGSPPGKREELTFELSGEYTEKLLKQVNNAYNTEINDILLTGLGLAVSDWTGAEKIPVMMEGHGREDIIPGVDVSRTVGWFTSIYPVVLDVTGKSDLSIVIKNTRDMLRRIPQKGIGYGILKYLTKEEHKQGSQFCQSPEISFNYLGQADADINNEFFRLAEIPGGNATAPGQEMEEKLTINGVVLKGRLTMSVSYNTRDCDEERIEVFINLYQKHLRQIIDHCTAREEAGLIAGDYGSSIPDQEVELVFDALSEIALDG